jgi:hypothetical protein
MHYPYEIVHNGNEAISSSQSQLKWWPSARSFFTAYTVKPFSVRVIRSLVLVVTVDVPSITLEALHAKEATPTQPSRPSQNFLYASPVKSESSCSETN